MTAPYNEPEVCPICSSYGKIQYSDCCGAKLIVTGKTTKWFTCSDCNSACNPEEDTCENCRGEGLIYPTDSKDDYTDIRIEETFLNRGL